MCTIGAVSEVTRILGSIAQGDPKAAEGLLALVYDEVRKLAARYPHKAELVKLRYFLGMTFEKAAAALDITLPTAKEWWAYARAWLAIELRKSG